MMNISLSGLLAGIQERKAELGIVDTFESTERMRNNGSRRTLRKRAMLAMIDERAQAAGIAPLKAYY